MGTAYLLKDGTVATWTDNGAKTYKADVLIEGSTITEIAENISPRPGVETIDCKNKWISPGFIDTHRHVWMTVLRGNQDDWLLTEYLVKNSWTIQPAVTPDDVRIGQLAGCLEALHQGVTTILDHFHASNSPEHAEAVLDATIQSGARVVWAPARQSPPTELFPELRFDNEVDTLKWQVEKLKEWGARDGGKLSKDGRVVLGLSYDVVGSGGDNTIHQEINKLARSIPVQVITAHVVKGPRIFDYRDAGLLGPDIVFSHCNELWDHPEPDDEMWAVMKNNGCAIASTPVDELGMAHGLPVAFEAVKRGVKCGLGADCLSINSGDMFGQMRTALQFTRGMSHENIHKAKQTPPLHNEYNSRDAFRLGTLGGAEALNLADQIGTIEVGKKADLLIFNALSTNLAGIRDPFNGIVFHASDADIITVFVDGEILKRDGKLTKFEWAMVAQELVERADILRERFSDTVLEERWQKHYAKSGGPTSWTK
ncbi:Metallo-dependent hydrolase [Irpex rosettiformis]|uniref:Metallo-dependent hydrolase n=1 Tax=Irpex rosettiformis TaxID=378272 RepID=A0ACB8U3Y8_9APHY|nr:Metallo-dependent hydrolase [Irpex rosettiformis]